MQSWKQFELWADSRRDLWLDCIRIYLGLGLLARGLLLVTGTHQGFFVDLYQRADRPWVMTALALHYVILGHLIGGALLTIGFFTRLAAAFQIPILFGAVFIIHRQEGLFALGQSLEFSALVLVLLCVFLVAGAGRLSVDHYVFGPASQKIRPVLVGS
jgi:uncharacterized membrane protein YphA (DoxX/SURF4 family)